MEKFRMSPAAKVWLLLGLGLAGLLILSRRRRKEIKVDFGAFVERLQLLPPPQPAPPIARHPLCDLTFAVQDAFDVEGHVTGFGNPDWAKTHEPAGRTAPSVSAVVAGGATCVGKTVMDEMAYSITGENKHYGTPTNPAVSSLMPGGSSSGSAVAVAAEIVDFALGVDTVGGVRIPAAFCGILGFRPSYGSVSTVGVVPMAQSFDTVGWFARDPDVLRRVGHILLQRPFMDFRRPRRILIADDCFQLSTVPKQRMINVVNGSIEKLYGSKAVKHIGLGQYIASKVPSLKAFQNEGRNGGGQYIASKVPSLKVFQNEEDRNEEGGIFALKALSNALQLLQRYEFKMNYEEWVNMVKPILGPGVSAGVHVALGTTDESIESCLKVRIEMRTALNNLLKEDGILVIPTTPGPPLKNKTKERLLEDFHSRALSLSSVASMSGCCQVSIPLGKHDGCPVAVSLLANYASDRFLLDTVLDMQSSLQEQVEIALSSQPSITVDSQIESAEIFKEKGNAAFKGKQWHKAVNFYSEAINLNDKNATYYSNRAAAYLELGRFQQAELDCSKAISLDKKNVKAYLRRGTAREMLSNYKEADEDFRYALVLEPTNKTASLAVKRLKKLFV